MEPTESGELCREEVNNMSDLIPAIIRILADLYEENFKKYEANLLKKEGKDGC